MTTDKQNIYAKSYTMKPIDNTESLEELEVTPEDVRRWKAMSERKKVGLLLKAEKAQGQTIQKKAKRLQEENLRLNGIIREKSRMAAPHLKVEQKKNDILQQKVKRLTEENRRLVITVNQLQKDALLHSRN